MRTWRKRGTVHEHLGDQVTGERVQNHPDVLRNREFAATNLPDVAAGNRLGDVLKCNDIIPGDRVWPRQCASVKTPAQYEFGWVVSFAVDR